MNNRKIPLSVAIGMSALLTACAGTPENDRVSEARTSYEAIAENPDVARSGASALRQAKNHLERAEKLLEEGADDKLVEHEAYLANRYAEVARTQGERTRIQNEIEQAERRREQLRLEMRSAEANQAQSEAQRARNEAEQLRRQMQELREMQAQQTDRGMVLTLGDILFDLNEATLQGPGMRTIDELASFLKRYEDRRIRIEGYTDSTGAEEYNQKLSQRRAEAVRDAVVDRGVAPDRIEVRGFGEAYPVASNDDPSGRQRNRRVEIVISDEEGNIQSR